MTTNDTSTATPISITRVFWRTVALLVFFNILLLIFRQSIQGHSLFVFVGESKRMLMEKYLSYGFLVDLFYFFSAVFFVHFSWALLIALSCKPLFKFTSNENIKTQCWFLLVLIHITLILAANAHFYPTSIAAFLRDTPLNDINVILGLSTFLAILLMLGLYEAAPKLSLLLLFVGIAGMIALKYYDEPKANKQVSDNKQPHIIIIGIDALRPDHLAYRGANNPLSPQLNKFLSNAVIYDKTYTPMARTYVAWLSLLKSQYPITHGARFNLMPPELLDKRIPFLTELKKHGYYSTYASDERRFSHIDKSYGYDNIIGPQIGAADSVTQRFADLPLINLMTNLPVSKYIFPFLYINRAIGMTYDTNRFNQDVLQSLALSKPNLLNVHFCMLHWPYTSKEFINASTTPWQGNFNHYLYQELIKKVDKQFGEFINDLAEKGILDNALFYLVSDHGEGFKLAKDTLINNNYVNTPLFTSAWGHGTNIINQEQNEVLLAYARFKNGKAVNQAVKINGVFSLVDIVPSIFNELNLYSPPDNYAFEGKVLPVNNASLDKQRMVFIESSHRVKAINASFIDQQKVMAETVTNYEIRANGRIVLKPEAYAILLKKKQRAVYFKKWQLAMYPNYDDLILINTTNKHWYKLSNYQGSAPWPKMLASLCKHYQDDIGFDLFGQCNNINTTSES